MRPRFLAVLALLPLALAPARATAQLQPSALIGVVWADQRQEYNLRQGWTPLSNAPEARLGWTVGGALRWRAVPRLSLVAEAALTWKGYEREDDAMKALHAELPLLVEVELARFGGAALALDGGFAWSRELWCRARYPELPVPLDGPTGATVTTSECRESRTELEELSSVFGVRVGSFPVLGLDVTPELRWVIGKTHSDGPGPFFRWQNRSFTARLSVAP
jgi:hypothetical protein